MPKASKYLMAVCLAAVLLYAQASRKIEPYRGAVAGEDIHVGSVANLLGSSRTYAKSDCSVKLLDDQPSAGALSLDLQDSFQNQNRPAYLVAHIKNATGEFSYELRCGEESGIGIIHVSPAKSILVSPESNIFLELSAEQAAKDQYVYFHGIEGNNVSLKLDNRDPAGFFEVSLGGLKDLKFYEKKDDGSVVEVRVSTFDKVLPIKEWDFKDNGVQQESDLVSTIAVLQNDGATVSYYELEESKDVGRVYVHSGNKVINAGKDYTLDHCFPVMRDGVLTNYYCTFEVASAKAKGPIVYYDIASTDDELTRREFSHVKSILAVTPLADGRTCFLALDEKNERNILCFDASSGFDKTADNEKTYFSGKSITIDVNGEECPLNLNTLDPTDFRFADAAVFDCKAGKVLASFELGGSDASASATVKSYKFFDPKLTVPVCASEDEIITLEDKNTTLVFEGGHSRPGQIIRYHLGTDSAAIQKVHCARDSALVLMESRRKTYLLDVNRGLKSDSITRVNSYLDISDRPSTMKVATSQTAILYGFNKKGQVESLLQYNGFLGLVRVTNKNLVDAADHTLNFTVTDGVQRQRFTVRTSIQADERFSVQSIKPLKGLVPGQEYPLREFFKITGQVTSLTIAKPNKTRNIFWHPDEVVFENSTNGTSKGSKFALGDYFVNIENKSYTNRDGAERKLDATILSESRYLGELPLDQPVAVIATREDGHLSVQGLFVGKTGEVQGSKIVKLTDEVEEEFVYAPYLATIDGKHVVVFYQSSENDESKGIAVEYKFDKELALFQFINQDNQRAVEYSASGSINGYNVKPIKSERPSRLNSCIQFKLSGEDLPVSRVYHVCGVTGGSSERVEIRNLVRTADSKVKFDLLNYPSAKAGSQSISWWEVTSNLLDLQNKPVAPSAFEYTVNRVRRFDGIRNHSIKKLFNLGNYSVLLTEHEEKGLTTLNEVYFGNQGTRPYYSRKVNDPAVSVKNYDLQYAVVRGVPKRIYTNFGRGFSNVADLRFKDSRIKLSKHLASRQVKQPFTLLFNDAFKVADVQVDLDKFYEDDGKTDEDDERTDPEDDPMKPGIKKRRSRLWFILGILALIIVVGAADLYLRRRSAEAETESAFDHEKPKVVKKKKGKEDGELSRSLNEL